MGSIKKIGIIGFGTIGQRIVHALRVRDDVDISFVLVRSTDRRDYLGLSPEIFTSNEEEALQRPADLVVEAAMPEVVARLAPPTLRSADFCAFSSTALADRETEASIRAATAASGTSFYVPHGAVLALDGLADGRELIDSVSITTSKSGESLGIDPDAEGVLFEGSSREACKMFPRNVNVHAAVSIAGIGFDRTKSRIVAVSSQREMTHRIEVKGKGLNWDLLIASQSLGGVTGSYTPHSAAGSLLRLLGGGGLQPI